MAPTLPIIQDETLTYQQDGTTAQMMVDSPRWYAWLRTASTFTFRSGAGVFTAHKERAGNRRGEAYWRAYRKRGGKLHRIYLGKSEELTLEWLKTVARVLAGQETGDGSLNRHKQAAGTRVATAASHDDNHPHLHLLAPIVSSVKAQPFFADLPLSLTPLIGREQEQTVLCRLLRQPEVRLVTLTGTGGVGKTRVVLQVAAELGEDFADGVCFVPLAPVREPEQVLTTIAQMLGLREAVNLPLEAQVRAFLQEKHLLLLLDNFEQVIAAAPVLARLLTSCRRLRLLVTSRAALHLLGEHEFALAPLPIPNLTQLPTLADLAQVETVHLFVERAQAIKADFELTEANARTIAEICVRLDGLPLAIELAAIRIKLLPPQALLKRLSHRLDLLTAGAQDLPDRQQTLRNTIEWSYNLLTEQEQHYFRRLSIFAGGCTFEAAEFVCKGDDDLAIGVLDGLASLIDKSLLKSIEQEREEPRLVMLETICEYGLEALVASGELAPTRYAHAVYYLRLSELAEQEFSGPTQAIWLERLEREYDNLRTAMQWLLEQGESGSSRAMALRLCRSLEQFWEMRGPVHEGRDFLERALAESEGVEVSVRAKALQSAVDLALIQDDIDRAEPLCVESLQLFRELGDMVGVAFTLSQLGFVARMRNDLHTACSLGEEAVELSRSIGSTESLAHTLHFLAFILLQRGEYSRAQTLFEERLMLSRKTGNKQAISSSLFQLAQVLFEARGDSERVHSLLEESLALSKELNYKDGLGACSYLAGKVALSQGDTVTAYALLEENIRFSKESGDHHAIADALSVLGRVASSQCDLVTAHLLYKESLAEASKIGDKPIIASSLEGLGAVAAGQGEPVWAAQLWGTAASLREMASSPITPVERAVYEEGVTAVRVRLGEKTFTAAWTEGKAMTLEQVLAARKSPTIFEQLPGTPQLIASGQPSSTHPAGLTAREVEVLRLVAQGLTNAQIAEQLIISFHTVNAHVRSIFNKLDVNSRNAVTRFAIAHQLI